MRSPEQDRKKLNSYAVLVVLCALALATALLNGFLRGHWFRFGIFCDAIVGFCMMSLYLKEKRNLKRY